MRNLSLPCGNTWRSSQQWHRSGRDSSCRATSPPCRRRVPLCRNDRYQKSQLTGQEQAQWEALVEAYGEDGSNLPEKTFTLTFEFIGQEGSSDPFKSFLALKNKGFRYANVIELSPNDEWWVYIRTETGTALNELDYEIYRVESTGATLSELRWIGPQPIRKADTTRLGRGCPFLLR